MEFSSLYIKRKLMYNELMNLAQVIQQIKERTSLVEYVGRYVSLKRFGNYYKGLCPFHNEKTSSFTVRTDFYHCFGCGEHGDVLLFLQKIKQQSFMEVVRSLASDLGIEIKTDLNDSYTKMQKILLDFVEQAHNKVHLIERYVRSRGITERSMQKYMLGYTTRDVMSKYANIDPEIKQQLGLTNMIQDRLIFPIKSGNTVVGIGARTLNDQGPKYINSPESMLFQKRRLLYGDGFAEKHGRYKTLLCEGYIDVILTGQIQDDHGTYMYNALAPLGTALTQEQCLRLVHVDKSPYLCLDGDAAGVNASMKSAKLAMQFINDETNIHVVELPENLDPADMVQSGRVEEFNVCIANARSVNDYIIEHTLAKATTPETMVKAKVLLRQILLTMQNRDARDILARFWKRSVESHIYKLGLKSKRKNKLPHVHSGISHIKVLLGLPILHLNWLTSIYDAFIALELTGEMQIVQQMILEKYQIYMMQKDDESAKSEKNEEEMSWNDVDSDIIMNIDENADIDTDTHEQIDIATTDTLPEFDDTKASEDKKLIRALMSDPLLKKYAKYVEFDIPNEESFINLWTETQKIYVQSHYKEELSKLQKELETEFTQEKWNRIMYVNKILNAENV